MIFCDLVLRNRNKYGIINTPKKGICYYFRVLQKHFYQLQPWGRNGFDGALKV